VIYVLGSGPLESAAQTLAVCYLQEMQWQHAVAVGSGEFLHGSFEVVTENLPVLVLLGEDATRPMGDRVRRFLDRYTTKAHYIDAAELSLDGVEQPMRPFIGSLVVGSALLGRLAEHFESWSGHSLKDRRYMWRVEY
jgi:fructoselysine-6-P-deglycase FrlB-like protein